MAALGMPEQNQKQGLVFISCGQFTAAEITLGQSLATAVDELTDFHGYFAENQNSLEGLSRNIFDALNHCSGLVAVMHRRGEVATLTGRHIRGSVWVEQEIAIAAFLKQAQSRNIQVAVYIQRGIQREGVRDQLHLNPVEFESEDEVLDHFRKRITDGLFSPTLMLEEALRQEKPDVRGSVSDVEVSWYKDRSTEITFKLSVCNHSDAETNLTSLLFLISDAEGKTYSTAASASRTEIHEVTETVNPLASQIIQVLGGPRTTRRSTVDLIDVVLKRGITLRFEGNASFKPPLPREIGFGGLSVVARDYISQYQLSIVGGLRVYDD